MDTADTAMVSCGVDWGEPNDSLQQAGVLPFPSTGLVVWTDNEDFYRIVIPAGQQADISVFTDPGQADIDVDLYDEAGNELDSSGTMGAVETVAYTNFGTTDMTVILRVFVWTQSPECGNYDVTVLFSPAPSCPPDSEEENDTIATASDLFGPLVGVNASPGDPDFLAGADRWRQRERQRRDRVDQHRWGAGGRGVARVPLGKRHLHEQQLRFLGFHRDAVIADRSA